MARPVCKQLLLYVEAPDKSHRILVVVSGSPFIFERAAYKVGVARKPGHLLAMTALNDVHRIVASLYSDLEVDYI